MLSKNSLVVLVISLIVNMVIEVTPSMISGIIAIVSRIMIIRVIMGFIVFASGLVFTTDSICSGFLFIFFGCSAVLGFQ